MIIDLIGIVPDGTGSLESEPQPLRFAVGETVQIRLHILTSGGIPSSAAGPTFTLTVKKCSSDGDALLTKTGVVAPTLGPNVITFSFLPADTKCFTPGSHVHDVWRAETVEAVVDRRQVVPVSSLTLLPACGLPT